MVYAWGQSECGCVKMVSETGTHLAKGVEALEAPQEAVPSHGARWACVGSEKGCMKRKQRQEVEKKGKVATV